MHGQVPIMEDVFRLKNKECILSTKMNNKCYLKYDLKKQKLTRIFKSLGVY